MPAFVNSLIPGHASVVVMRGRGIPSVAAGMLVVAQPLPTDSIGSFVLVLTDVAVGSAIRVETASGGEFVASATAASSTVELTLPAYVAGSANNNLRIKVRKGSASPFYQPWETLAVAFDGTASIFVSQIPDE